MLWWCYGVPMRTIHIYAYAVRIMCVFTAGLYCSVCMNVHFYISHSSYLYAYTNFGLHITDNSVIPAVLA